MRKDAWQRSKFLKKKKEIVNICLCPIEGLSPSKIFERSMNTIVTDDLDPNDCVSKSLTGHFYENLASTS